MEEKYRIVEVIEPSGRHLFRPEHKIKGWFRERWVAWQIRTSYDPDNWVTVQFGTMDEAVQDLKKMVRETQENILIIHPFAEKA